MRQKRPYIGELRDRYQKLFKKEEEYLFLEELINKIADNCRKVILITRRLI